MNSFGSASKQFALCDARETYDHRSRFRREILPALSRVNSFYSPTGRWCFRGWILLPRFEYNQLDPYSTDFQLNIGDTSSANNTRTLKNLCIAEAVCATRGLASDPNALMLLELTDDEGVVYNDWFQTPLTTAYNIRAPAYPQTFQPWSMNGGTTWTWSTMLQDIWGKMATAQLLGTWPGLPFTPSGTPEGFWFPGVPAWSSFIDTLEYLGMTLTIDLSQVNPYGIVRAGALDTAFTALQTKYAGNLEDDLEWQDAGQSRFPGVVTVAFHRRNIVYGSEETVRYDQTLQWQSAPYYTVAINAPTQFSKAIGTHLIWSDFTVRYDQDGTPLAADVAMANVIAQERVNQYFDKIYGQTVGFMTQTYAGALPFTTGSQVDGVCWFQDGDYGGWRTQIVRGAFPPWSGLWDQYAYPIG